MWPRTFAHRLESWAQLRATIAAQPVEQALHLTNNWWFTTPWSSYHLHWDDLPTWPDPWQLLSDNIYCDVARGLGILYTLTLAGHSECATAELMLTAQDYNLVLVQSGKYILNWEAGSVVNTSLGTQVRRRLTSQQVAQKYI
jgi:hypothetical protein